MSLRLGSSSAAQATRQALPAPRLGSVQRAGVRPNTRVAVATMVAEVQTWTPATVPQVDAELLNKRLEAKAKALIALEEQETPTRPLVRVRVSRQIGIGEAWKLVGRIPELGRFTPEVAPYMKWNDGNVWTYEGRIRRGTWTYKLVLARPDRAYVWEEGADRVLEIPEDLGPDDVVEVVIDNIKMPY